MPKKRHVPGRIRVNEATRRLLIRVQNPNYRLLPKNNEKPSQGAPGPTGECNEDLGNPGCSNAQNASTSRPAISAPFSMEQPSSSSNASRSTTFTTIGYLATSTMSTETRTSNEGPASTNFSSDQSSSSLDEQCRIS